MKTKNIPPFSLPFTAFIGTRIATDEALRTSMNVWESVSNKKREPRKNIRPPWNLEWTISWGRAPFPEGRHPFGEFLSAGQTFQRKGQINSALAILLTKKKPVGIMQWSSLFVPQRQIFQ
jgi:hypothetical protein